MNTSLRITPMLTRCVHRALTRRINITNRFFSGKVTNISTPALPRIIQREHKYVLPYLHVMQAKELNIVSRIAYALNYWLHLPDDKVNEIQELACTAVNATVLIDDIADDVTLRCKMPAAHTIFSIGNTINAANLVQCDALRAADQLGHPDAMKTMLECLTSNYEGQAMELYWGENAYVPTEEEYEKCIEAKTGSLIFLPLRLMQLFSKEKYDLDPLLITVTKYFQMHDDYNDIQSSQTNSISNDDISAGKYSYPIIHALRKNPDDYQIHRILQLRTHDMNIKRHLISLLEKYGSLEHTRNVLNKLEQEVRSEIKKLGGNPLFDQITDRLKAVGVST